MTKTIKLAMKTALQPMFPHSCAVLRAPLRWGVFLALALATQPAWGQAVEPELEAVEGAWFDGGQRSKGPAKRVAAARPPSLVLSLTPPAAAALPPLSPGELERLRPHGGLAPIGVHRALPAGTAELSFSGGAAKTTVAEAWQATVVGRLWRLQVTSPGARALRIHFQDFDAGKGSVWVHAADGQVDGPHSGRGMWGDGDFWSDIVFGDSATIEYRPDSEEPPAQAAPFRIAAVSHIRNVPGLIGGDDSPARAAEAKSPTGNPSERLVAAEAQSLSSGPPSPASHTKPAPCHQDVSCHSDFSREATGVAHIQFENENGSMVCSGALLIDSHRTFIPYFLTAAHCINTDAEARSLIAYWSYRTQTCNGTPPSRSSVPRTNGAHLLATMDGGLCTDEDGEEKICTDRGGDATLLRLEENPPGRRFFMGWDPNPQSVGTSVTGIHHPAGSHKRISFGRIASQVGSYHRVSWSQGRVEPGSSGSPLLKGKGFEGAGIVIGILSFGEQQDEHEDICLTNPRAGYMKFSDFYPRIRRFLEGEDETSPPPTASLTASPGSIQRGGSATLRWSSTNAASARIDPGIGAVATSGSRTVSPTATTTYRITVTSADGRTASDSATVTVTASPPTDDHGDTPAEATALSAGSSVQGRIETGDDVDYFRLQIPAQSDVEIYTSGSLDTVGSLRDSSNAVIDGNDDGGTGTNFRIARRLAAGVYYIAVSSFGSGTGSYTLHASVAGGGTPPPTVSLTASPGSIQRGGSATLRWSSTNAASARIDQGIGNVATSGSRTVSPTATTTYRITVTSADGRTAADSATVTVTATPPPPPPDATGIITTVAGTGTPGYSGDGGQAAQAQLWGPLGVALDGLGNLYFTEQNNQRIRKVNTDGWITTVAGTGTQGHSGDGYSDGGQATRARLNFPLGVALDTAGNLYFADSGTHRIRKVNTDGWITTVAGTGTHGYSGDGGQATRARLSIPTGVALDGLGNLYFADGGNHRIRKVNTDGWITTVAGTGTPGYSGDGGQATRARLNIPWGVALDGLGNLYFTDPGSHCIRKVNTDGWITTVAGTGEPGYSGDGGQATRARLWRPRGVALDGLGNLYFAENNYDRIRKVDAAGVISTVAGGSRGDSIGDGGPATAARLSSPSGVAVDGAGNLFIADTSNHRIRRVGGASAPTSTDDHGDTPAEATALSAGSSVQGRIETSGDVDYFRLQIPAQSDVEIYTTGSLDTVGSLRDSSNAVIADDDDGGTGTNFRIARRLAAGVYYIAVGSSGSGTGSYTLHASVAGGGTPPPTVSLTASPGSIQRGGSATLRWSSTNAASARIDQGIGNVATSGSRTVSPTATTTYRITVTSADGRTAADSATVTVTATPPPPPPAATGIITTVAGTGEPGYSGDGGQATRARLNFPLGVALDGLGNLYFADVHNHRIRKVDTDGWITTVAGTGTQGYSGDGGQATQARLNTPLGVALDGLGNLYFADVHADVHNHRIRKVNTDGWITTVAGTGTRGYSGDGGQATRARLNFPLGVALDGLGNLYFADVHNHRIRKVDTDGWITTVAGTGTQGYSGDGGQATQARLNIPWGVALDGLGNLYFTEQNNHRIRKVDTDGWITTVAGTGTQGYSGDGGQATRARLSGPRGVALDTAGNLYFADSGNHRIRKVNTDGWITTVAGTGTQGYSGDGGQATRARLSIPTGVALDGLGNLYFADTDNHRIRKVKVE